MGHLNQHRPSSEVSSFLCQGFITFPRGVHQIGPLSRRSRRRNGIVPAERVHDCRRPGFMMTEPARHDPVRRSRTRTRPRCRSAPDPLFREQRPADREIRSAIGHPHSRDLEETYGQPTAPASRLHSLTPVDSDGAVVVASHRRLVAQRSRTTASPEGSLSNRLLARTSLTMRVHDSGSKMGEQVTCFARAR